MAKKENDPIKEEQEQQPPSERTKPILLTTNPPPLDKSAIFTPTGTVSDFDLQLATHLRNLSFATFDILNHKTLTPQTLSHLSPDFTSTTELPDHPAQATHDRDTHIQNLQIWLKANPRLFCKIINVSVKLGNNNRRATVWLTNVLGITGVRRRDVALRRESLFTSLAVPTDTYYGDVKRRNPLFTRAWAFQEDQITTRVLSFGA
ncbi:hypothetical protein PRZ48_010042 [Zasmidium cellare]|uniref:Uncharacterized protein n=1 Tax=Zasmidium cellare TaxID=395010 RepID=A0ABR0EE19_ZASCE|nr:hypothetical protein PRZ48_010042 [Zasmidium cellare]